MKIWFSLLVMILTIYAVRLIPMLLLRGDIRSPFIKSFLYYVPYVTLAVMTFPAIVLATENPISGALALIVGLVMAWIRGDLFTVAISCCVVVLLSSLIL